MTKKRAILILAMFMLVVIPISTTEIPHQASADEKVLATTTVAKPATTVTAKPAAKPAVKKPVAKKVVKKKAPAKKKERLITAPPLITVETAPHSGR